MENSPANRKFIMLRYTKRYKNVYGSCSRWRVESQTACDTTFVPLFFFGIRWCYGDFVGKDLVCDDWILEELKNPRTEKRMDNKSEAVIRQQQRNKKKANWWLASLW